MRFSQSERQLHQETQFTPPCNHYQPQPAPSLVTTGSLAGPSLPVEHPHFGLSTRFALVDSSTPGPATYHASSPTPAPNKTPQKLRDAKKMGFLRHKDNHNPSIPSAQQQSQQEEEEYRQQLAMEENATKTALGLKKSHSGHTFSRSPRKTVPQPAKQPPPPALHPIIEEQMGRKIFEAPRKQASMQEQVRKANYKRHEIINTIHPQFTPSLELIDNLTRRRTKYVPGPGAYATPDKTASQNAPSFPTTRRFSVDIVDKLGPGAYQETSAPSPRSSSFAKSSRPLFDMKTETDLTHRFYIHPDENRPVSRNKNPSKHPFGSQQPRFYIEKKQQSKEGVREKDKRAKRIEAAVEVRLKRLKSDKLSTGQSEGLLGLSSMVGAFE